MATIYTKTCRGCLIEDGATVMFPLHDDAKLADLYEECTNIRVPPEAVGPQLLCQQCRGKLQRFKKFKDDCWRSERLLQQPLLAALPLSQKEIAPRLYKKSTAASDTQEPPAKGTVSDPDPDPDGQPQIMYEERPTTTKKRRAQSSSFNEPLKDAKEKRTSIQGKQRQDPDSHPTKEITSPAAEHDHNLPANKRIRRLYDGLMELERGPGTDDESVGQRKAAADPEWTPKEVHQPATLTANKGGGNRWCNLWRINPDIPLQCPLCNVAFTAFANFQVHFDEEHENDMMPGLNGRSGGGDNDAKVCLACSITLPMGHSLFSHIIKEHMQEHLVVKREYMPRTGEKTAALRAKKQKKLEENLSLPATVFFPRGQLKAAAAATATDKSNDATDVALTTTQGEGEEEEQQQHEAKKQRTPPLVGPLHKKKPFLCHLCNQRFVVEDALKMHLRTSHAPEDEVKNPYVNPYVQDNEEPEPALSGGGTPTMYPCNICNREFTVKSNRNRHERKCPESERFAPKPQPRTEPPLVVTRTEEGNQPKTDKRRPSAGSDGQAELEDQIPAHTLLVPDVQVVAPETRPQRKGAVPKDNVVKVRTITSMDPSTGGVKMLKRVFVTNGHGQPLKIGNKILKPVQRSPATGGPKTPAPIYKKPTVAAEAMAVSPEPTAPTKPEEAPKEVLLEKKPINSNNILDVIMKTVKQKPPVRVSLPNTVRIPTQAPIIKDRLWNPPGLTIVARKSLPVTKPGLNVTVKAPATAPNRVVILNGMKNV